MEGKVVNSKYNIFKIIQSSLKSPLGYRLEGFFLCYTMSLNFPRRVTIVFFSKNLLMNHLALSYIEKINI